MFKATEPSPKAPTFPAGGAQLSRSAHAGHARLIGAEARGIMTAAVVPSRRANGMLVSFKAESTVPWSRQSQKITLTAGIRLSTQCRHSAAAD